jgi:hypothetical protein
VTDPARVRQSYDALAHPGHILERVAGAPPCTSGLGPLEAAVFGALNGLSALTALFLGVLLAG